MPATSDDRLPPPIPPAGDYSTWEISKHTGIHTSTINRIAEALGLNHGSGNPIHWSWRDLQVIRIARRLEEAGSNDTLAVLVRAVLEAHPIGGPDPVLAGWVAYGRGQIRYGATPSEAIGPLSEAVVAHLRGAP